MAFADHIVLGSDQGRFPNSHLWRLTCHNFHLLNGHLFALVSREDEVGVLEEERPNAFDVAIRVHFLRLELASRLDALIEGVAYLLKMPFIRKQPH